MTRDALIAPAVLRTCLHHFESCFAFPTFITLINDTLDVSHTHTYVWPGSHHCQSGRATRKTAGNMEQILRRELKAWQKAFKAQHGREPTKRDILADPAVAGTYDTWQAVGGDAKFKPKTKASSSSSSTSITASTSKQGLDDRSSQREGHLFKTPSKRKAQKFYDGVVPPESPSRNPFRTPTKGRTPLLHGVAKATTTPESKRNPFTTPTKTHSATANSPVEASPAKSVIEVEMTPTKRSPLDSFPRRSHFTPTESLEYQQYVTSSPSKLRSTLAAAMRRTPPKTRVTENDAVLSQALVAYTPRTKARKRLRGEEVPPTPNRPRVSDAMAAAASGAGLVRTDPRPVHKGLGAFGFASHRKPVGVKRGVTAPASVFSRTRSTQDRLSSAGRRSTGQENEVEEDEDMLGSESHIKRLATLRRTPSTKPSFRPLFASPSGNRVPRDVLDVGETVHAACKSLGGNGEEDADAVMDEGVGSPVGGLFAAEVHQRWLRRARDNESNSGVDESVGKKHKSRLAPNLPAPASSDDEGDQTSSTAFISSSPAYRKSLLSSPNTEMTIPSSVARSAIADHTKSWAKAQASSPAGETEAMKTQPKSKSQLTAGAGVVGWRKVRRVELSDEDEHPTRYNAQDGGAGGKGKEGKKKIISITPYQRYGTLRTSRPSAEFEDEEEEQEHLFTPYTLGTPVYAVHPTPSTAPTSSDCESESDPHSTSTSFAGLKLSPVRHAPSSKPTKQQRLKLLSNIFEPTTRNKAARTAKALNPEARFGSLQPFSGSVNDDDDEEDEDYDGQSRRKGSAGAAGSDDDDDWQQEVDEDFTFIDSEIELPDVA